MDLPPKIRIGTSGWSYDGWRGPFYPQGGSRKNWLGLYAETFNTVEVNNSFYRLPERKSVEGWVSATPQDFCFSVKASRYITHTKKLKTDGIEKFFAAIKPFGTKLGPVLFQLPPGWKLDLGRLEVFLKKLPAEYKYAFEFRNQSWLCEQVYDLLEKSGSALCFYDYRGFSSPEIITSDFIYVRLHGPLSDPYKGSYKASTLKNYAKKFLQWSSEGRQVFCFFDNDQKARAPGDAQRLLAALKNYEKNPSNFKKL